MQESKFNRFYHLDIKTNSSFLQPSPYTPTIKTIPAAPATISTQENPANEDDNIHK